MIDHIDPKYMQLACSWIRTPSHQLLDEFEKEAALYLARLRMPGSWADRDYLFRHRMRGWEKRWPELHRFAVRADKRASIMKRFALEPLSRWGMAVKIQRAWRKAIADPSTALCKRRLRREFSGVAAPGDARH